MAPVPSSICTCGTEDQTTEHILQKMSSISTSQGTDMVRGNIITPESVWEERRTRENSWLQSAGWFIRVIK